MHEAKENEIQSLREDLFRVVHHYAELANLAKKGEMNPLGQIGRILSNSVPYLLLVIRDILTRLDRKEITYHEALYHVLTAARHFPDQEFLTESRNQIQKIEQESRIFLYAVKWLDAHLLQRPSPQEAEAVKAKLGNLNEKYRQRYSSDEDQTATMIPHYLPPEETESQDTIVPRVADLVSRAVLELHHLMVEREPAKSFLFFTSSHRKEIEDDLMQLNWFLFRCGYTVERIARGYHKDSLAAFLNEKLLDYLIGGAENVDSLHGLSTHMFVISLLDYRNFFELPQDYLALDDPKEVARHARTLKSKKRMGADLLRKLSDLNKVYGSRPQGRMAQNFLQYRYYVSHGDYFGDHRLEDPRAARAVDLYKPVLDRSAMEKRAEEDLDKNVHGFSSKTRDEMGALIKLIMDSLYDPRKVGGKKVKVLGDISSGAMGKVSIGIYKSSIVALKRVKTAVPTSLGDPVTLLKYEAAMHARVQSPDQHPSIVEYYGLIEQDAELLLVNGYYPNDNLTSLVEKNWREKYKPPFNTQSKLDLATLEIIINELLECLKVFRERGMIHRDLKTDNILYTVDEEEKLNRLKIIDFGVALSTGREAVEDLFKGKVVGTFAYMAPEQSRGKSEFQSDLYSVGAILAVLLTGRLPMLFPKAASRPELLKQLARIEREPRAKVMDQNPFLKKNTILEHMAVIIDRMLDLDPLRRPTLDEVQEAFNGVFQHIGNKKYTTSIFYHRG